MIHQKFVQSRQTLNTDRMSSQPSFYTNRKITHEVFINPYPAKPLLKFPKNKTVRKQTHMHTLVQTINHPQKFCIKPFSQIANKTTMNELKQSRRISKFGKYNPLSKSLDMKNPSIRTFEDIGISHNMKKVQFYPLKYRSDPIVVGEIPKKIGKCNSTVWKDQRKLRDNGETLKQSLVWDVNPQTKRQQYSGKVKSSTQSIKSQISDFSNTLNYKRRK